MAQLRRSHAARCRNYALVKCNQGKFNILFLLVLGPPHVKGSVSLLFVARTWTEASRPSGTPQCNAHQPKPLITIKTAACWERMAQ
ncbi:hypothetical protein KC329_g50 [Hortaea werneckii]|nr:hypothetical protein KC329_g50 [Hortaea werneckii]